MAAKEAHAWLNEQLANFVTDRTTSPWILAASRSPSFFAPTAKLGSGSFYLATYHDSGGKPLRGENTYRLHVPTNVPVREFWAFTVYSLETAALFRESQTPHARLA